MTIETIKTYNDLTFMKDKLDDTRTRIMLQIQKQNIKNKFKI